VQVLEIDERFCGPPGIGNGGYVAGRLAAILGAEAMEVTLRRPAPLMRALQVQRDGESVLLKDDGENVVAQGRAAFPSQDQPPVVPTYEEAVDASRRYIGFCNHPVPRCFVCGIERPDGLRIFPGTLPPWPQVLAAPWVPDHSLANGERVAPEFVWAALDCSGAFACMDDRLRPMLLGRITGRVSGEIRVGEKCIVSGWQISSEGRKHLAGTAVWNEAGEVRGIANAIWFDLPPRAES